MSGLVIALLVVLGWLSSGVVGLTLTKALIKRYNRVNAKSIEKMWWLRKQQFDESQSALRGLSLVFGPVAIIAGSIYLLYIAIQNVTETSSDFLSGNSKVGKE